MSLFLALIMVCSLSVSVFAANPVTKVTYTGEGSEAYTVTVPTTLEPGQSGEIKAEGTWAGNRTLKVTTDSTVTVTNSIDGGEKILDVTFDGILQNGDNRTSVLVSKDISVGDISNALFGTWTGVITYNVSMKNNFTIFNSEVGINGRFAFDDGMTWENWLDSEYNDGSFYTYNNYIVKDTEEDMWIMILPPITYRAVTLSDTIDSNKPYKYQEKHNEANERIYVLYTTT